MGFSEAQSLALLSYVVRAAVGGGASLLVVRRGADGLDLGRETDEEVEAFFRKANFQTAAGSDLSVAFPTTLRRAVDSSALFVKRLTEADADKSFRLLAE